MEKISFGEIRLIGISLDKKTTNMNGQSAIDCGNHWQKFESGKYFDKIPGKTGNEIYAVYHEYEGDHTKPYSYFIGCKVDDNSTVPEGMDNLTITNADYTKIIAKGKMPDCVGNAWMNIWNSDIKRAYKADFEIYDGKSWDWNNAEVAIYVGLQ